jgi:molybdate transport system substrate-binding protein
MSGQTLHVLCAGAVQGIVKALTPRFQQESGATLSVRFGAVGALKEMLLGGDPCDVLIVTDAMVSSLQASGELEPPATAVSTTTNAQASAPATGYAFGKVRTGVAVPRSRTGGGPAITSSALLKQALESASGIYCPDPTRSTAGIHFASVLKRLGIDDAVASRLHTYPNGATAMAALADAGPDAIGCTQITEIKYTPGIDLIGPLPAEFELATVYAAAVTERSAHPELARRFASLLAAPETITMRLEGGFELDRPPTT